MNDLMKCNLQLFADGSEGGADAVGIAGGADGESAGQFATDTGATAAGGDENADAQKEATFSEMNGGENKQQYERAIKRTLGQRLKTRDKKIAEHETFRGQVAPLLDKLAVKYGVSDASNIEAIMQAADKDNSFYEQYAAQRGVDIETAKQLLVAERITKEQERRQADEQRQQEFQQKYNGWLQQAAQVQQIYPEFDFETESTNEATGENFRRLLNSGVDVRTAYEVIHRDEVMGGAMQYAYQSAKRDMADARTSRKARVNENGTSSQQAPAVYDDMAKLSYEDDQKIRAAIRRGEKVNDRNFRDFL